MNIRKEGFFSKIINQDISEKQFESHVIEYARNMGWKVYCSYNNSRSEPGFPGLVLVRDVILFRQLKSENGRISKTQNEWAEALIHTGSDFKIWKPSMIKDIYEELK